MAELTEDQKAFIKKNRIPVSTIFDATGLTRKQYQSVMKELGKDLAIGVTPCKKAGHTLRTRAGHCVECFPASWSFLKRYDESGEVYLAGSRKGQFLKIGSAGSAVARMNSLRHLVYAGQVDWELITAFKTSKAGEVEYQAQAAVNAYAHPTTYGREGNEISCLETFKCRSSRALEALAQFIDSDGFQIEFDKDAFEYFDALDEKYGSFNRKGGGLNQEFSPSPAGTDRSVDTAQLERNPNLSTDGNEQSVYRAELELNHEEENQKNRLAPEEHQGLSSTSESIDKGKNAASDQSVIYTEDRREQNTGLADNSGKSIFERIPEWLLVILIIIFAVLAKVAHTWF